MKTLSPKQRLFVEHYTAFGMPTFGNATRSVEAAGYDTSNKETAAVIGSENLRKPNVAEAISERFKENSLSTEAALAILKEHALSTEPTVSLSALDKILKAQGAYTKNVDITSGGNSLDPSPLWKLAEDIRSQLEG